MNYQRKTLAGDAEFEGLGLHSAEPVTVKVRPGEQGIRFWGPSGMVAARPENVTDTRRCTKLGDISTIEHMMSALAGLEITDAEIEVSAHEMPAMDGAAQAYVEGILDAGIQPLGKVERKNPFQRVYVTEGSAKVAIAFGGGHWRYDFESATNWPFQQAYETQDVIRDYAGEIASARTWGFEHEVPHLHALGLARGLDLTKALVLGENGYVNEARFPDEPSRHKLLDAIGDLYLAGVPIHFLSVICTQSGHTLNVAAAAKLVAVMAG